MRKTSSFLLRPPATQTVRCMSVYSNNREAELAGHVASGIFVAVGDVAQIAHVPFVWPVGFFVSLPILGSVEGVFTASEGAVIYHLR